MDCFVFELDFGDVRRAGQKRGLRCLFGLYAMQVEEGNSRDVLRPGRTGDEDWCYT